MPKEDKEKQEVDLKQLKRLENIRLREFENKMFFGRAIQMRLRGNVRDIYTYKKILEEELAEVNKVIEATK